MKFTLIKQYLAQIAPTKKNQISYIFAGLLICLVSVLGTYIDKDFKYSGFILILWLIGLGTILFGYLIRKKKDKQHFHFDERLILVIFLAILTRFLFINVYPFPTIGDMARDGGIDAMNIAKGNVENIFFYGRYNSHALLIPTISSVFYRIFGNSQYVITLPSAILSTVDIILLYHFVKKYINPKYALWAALTLTAIPLHMYYGRTEIVVMFSSVLTTLSFMVLGNYLKKRDLLSILMVALLIGFSFNFHASIKPVSFVTLLIVVYYELKKFFATYDWKNILVTLFFSVIFVVAGFGPRLIYTTFDIFVKAPALERIEEQAEEDYLDTIDINLNENTPKALMVYFYEGAWGHYPIYQPILPFYLGIIFLAGIFFSLLSKALLPKILVAYAFILPITNSAITDYINIDNRLAPLLPIAAIFTAFGLVQLVHKLFRDNQFAHLSSGLMLVLSTLLLLVYNVYFFFDNETASYRTNQDHIYQEYMVTYLGKELQNDYAFPKACIHGNQELVDYFDLIHIREQFDFYSPDLEIDTSIDDSLDRFTVAIYPDCFGDALDYENMNTINYCDEYQKFVCPPDKKSFKLIFP